MSTKPERPRGICLGLAHRWPPTRRHRVPAKKLWPTVRSGLPLAGLLGAMLATSAQVPAWWTNRNVITTATNAVPNDYAPVNQGQVKWLVTQMAAELDDDLQYIGGAGSNVEALIASFSPTNNYLPVNLGQLKNVAKPFYDRFWVLALTNCYPVGSGRPYPWSNSTNQPNDYALANIGQAKWVFSFNTAVDSDNDGIPDIFERDIGSNPYFSDAGAVNTNAWAQGMTNRDLYQSLHALTIPNAWAVYTNTSQVAVVADVRSPNPFLTVKAAEFFLDSTNGVTFGSGTAMSAVDGAFNSTNETAQAIFTPAFPAGERHVFYIHAKDSANHWCPFVSVVLNPTINDVLNRVQANYAAMHDLQFDSSDAVVIDGVVQSSALRHVKQKGAYKYRVENPSNGIVEIINYNYDVKLSASQQILSYRVATTMDNFTNAVAAGPSGTPDSSQLEDFCWDVPTFRQAYSLVLDCNAVQGSNGWYYVVATATNGTETIQMAIDCLHGVTISKTSLVTDGIPLVKNASNMVEVLPGAWLPLNQTISMSLPSGTVLEWRRILSAVQVNKGLDDVVFAVPPAP